MIEGGSGPSLPLETSDKLWIGVNTEQQLERDFSFESRVDGAIHDSPCRRLQSAPRFCKDRVETPAARVVIPGSLGQTRSAGRGSGRPRSIPSIRSTRVRISGSALSSKARALIRCRILRRPVKILDLAPSIRVHFPRFHGDSILPEGNWFRAKIPKHTKSCRGNPGVFKIPVRGGMPVRLTTRQASNPVWSPAGNLIVYASPNVGFFTPSWPFAQMETPVKLPSPPSKCSAKAW